MRLHRVRKVQNELHRVRKVQNELHRVRKVQNEKQRIRQETMSNMDACLEERLCRTNRCYPHKGSM